MPDKSRRWIAAFGWGIRGRQRETFDRARLSSIVPAQCNLVHHSHCVQEFDRVEFRRFSDTPPASSSPRPKW
jgi:hypothetical protein